MNDDELRRLLTKLAAAAHLVASEYADLVSLAYDSTVSDAVAVSGGNVSDLHAVGDQRARTALTGIDKHMLPLLGHLNNAMQLLHATGPQDPPPRTRRQISRKEHGEAIDAQARRKARGEYTPHRNWPQPGIH